jgi:hypothetical protein
MVTIRIELSTQSSSPPEVTAKDFLIHRSAIIYKSTWFEAELNRVRRASDQDNQIITFRDVDPQAFALLSHYLYEQRIDRYLPPKKAILLFKVWELGERFGIAGLQNCVMNHLVPIIYNAKVVSAFRNGVQGFVLHPKSQAKDVLTSSQIPRLIAFAYDDGQRGKCKSLRRLAVAKLMTMPPETFSKTMQFMPDELKTDYMQSINRHVSGLEDEDKPKLGAPNAFYVKAARRKIIETE